MTDSKETSSVLSVVVPVYMGEPFLRELSGRLIDVIEALAMTPELVFVCDASPDASWETLRSLSELDHRIKVVSFTRNRGQHVAITAGLDIVSGDLVAVMDCDLQDAPEDLPLLIAALGPESQVVAGLSGSRGPTGLGYRAARGLYHRLHQAINPLASEVRNLSYIVMTKEVVMTIRGYREADRHISGIIFDAGYRVVGVPTSYRPRSTGTSSYTLRKRSRLAATSLVFHSNTWMSAAIAFGASLSALSILAGAFLVISRLLGATLAPGWTSIIVVQLFSVGVLLFILGLTGLYLSQVLSEVRQRPLYVIDRSINWPERPEG